MYLSEEKKRAYQRAYHERNRERLNAYAQAYREKNMERLNGYRRAYYAANADTIRKRTVNYRKENEKSCAEKQLWLRASRLARGLTQGALAELIGVSCTTISFLESGKLSLERFSEKDALCALLRGEL